MTILFTSSNWNWRRWVDRLAQRTPERTVFVHGVHDYDPAEVRYALTWKPQPGLLQGLPNLQAIFNLGAGVDALMAEPDLPEVPIVRLVDPDLTRRMGEWIVLQVLFHHRRGFHYLDAQRRRAWDEAPQPIAAEVRVGMMGYGVLARHAAGLLDAVGFAVHAWSRSPKPDADRPLFAGADELPAFLAGTDVLVALLPLTPETRGILDARLIDGLARDGALGGPVLVNAGRGGSQDEAAIAAALRDGRLKGASLDVFEEEPLPASSPLWDAPNLVLTPHVSAISSPEAVVPYVVDQIEAFERGEALVNLVDRARGY